MPSGVIYNHETVHLDGEHFTDCEFRDSRLVYSGGAAPVFDRCKVDACEWRFEGSAADTLAHLKAVWAAGGKSTVQALIKEITGAAK